MPSQTKAYESPTWKDYVATNQAFADTIVENYREGDLSKCTHGLGCELLADCIS